MARLESIALAGYYPTPENLVGPITRLLAHPEGAQNWVDPCAGKGEAILSVAKALHPDTRDLTIHSVEMESSRFETLKEAVIQTYNNCWRTTLHGDAFHVEFRRDAGCSLLWLNPPYDLDPKHGRLEERFLQRFADTLCEDGILIFIVPFYALKASAETLAREFTDLRCFRFPDEDFAAYRQVVLLAKKIPSLMQADPRVHDQVLSWSIESNIPSLPPSGPPLYTLPAQNRYESAFSVWELAALDLKAICANVQPWSYTTRSGTLNLVPGIIPDVPLTDLLTRSYPIAMPPRPAHIAAGIAAGIFNGMRIEPDDPESQLPPLLVKGVFDKEYLTVDEKVDKKGDVVSLIQVQQPKLVTTVLDLRTSRYHTIRASTESSGSMLLEDFTTADLLGHYGKGLMRVMLLQCPVMHDPNNPEHQIKLPKLSRPLFRAQAQATQAAIKLLGGLNAKKRDRRHKACYVLGEIGSGKTGVSLAAAAAIQAEKTLVLCPPHLLQSWVDQIQAVTPWVRVVILSDINDVQRLAEGSTSQEIAFGETNKPVVAILSRETAKLGHPWKSVGSVCPKCGQSTPLEDHAKKRSRCMSREIFYKDEAACLARDLSLALMPIWPDDIRISQLHRSRCLQKYQSLLLARKKDSLDSLDDTQVQWALFVLCKSLDPFVKRLTDLVIAAPMNQDLASSLVLAIMADPHPERIEETVLNLFSASNEDMANYGPGAWLRRLGRELLLLLPLGGKDQTRIAQQLREEFKESRNIYYGQEPWVDWDASIQYLQGNSSSFNHVWADFKVKDGKLQRKDKAVADPSLILDALAQLSKAATFAQGQICDEPLYQALPEPRRFPLASYVAKYHPRLFDLLIIDEHHEYSGDGTAQERAAHRLTSLGIPSLHLTGTVMNGYAESLFSNMWAASQEFRREFDREDRQKFVNRYGYRKRLIQDRDRDSKEIVAYGSHTDRIERTERLIGNAPGVLPLFVLKHLLSISVTIHKSDLALDIPQCLEHVEKVQPTKELLKRYKTLEQALIQQIRADRFEPELAGKLWGQLAELPSYLDRATDDTGNNENGTFEINYPESVGGGSISLVEGFPADTILPKEEWMLKKVGDELDEGRNVLVFAWHVNLLPRLKRLLESRFKTECPILHPTKVPAAKRQHWIDKEIVEKHRRILVVNPVAIQTGLNNLVYFSTEIWMQNPACNPILYRQAVGRVDRIAQTKESRIFLPIYEDTTQVPLHQLLMRKVAVSLSTDGLDSESALQAAGVGESDLFVGFAVGRQLYDLMSV